MPSLTLNERLLTAVAHNELHVVQECLNSGASLSHTDFVGCTALHLAAAGTPKDSLLEICRLLLRYGANTNQANKLRKTPLHLAAQFGNNRTAEALIANGSDLNSIDILQMTALHWTCHHPDPSLLPLLVNPDTLETRDKFGRSCSDIARSKGHFNLISRINQLQAEFLAGQQSLNQDIRVLEQVLKSQTIYPEMSKTKSRQRLAILDSSDSDSDTNSEIAKKKRISSSPQGVEETLLWLKNQAVADDSYSLEDREFYLTEAGCLALEHMNKIAPIGHEQRLLLKLAKDLTKEESDQEQPRDQSEDWLFSNDVDEFF